MNFSPDEIKEMIASYSDLFYELEFLRIQKDEVIQSVIPDDVKQKIEEIEDEYADKFDDAQERLKNLESVIKSAVLSIGESVDSDKHNFVFQKGRTTWKTKVLDDLAVDNPEILQARKQGKPFIQIKLKKG